MTFEAGPTMGASGVTREAYEAMERANALLRARLSMVEMANIIAQARIQAALDICAARLTADTDPVRFAALVRDALTVPLPINPEKVDNAARAALVEPVGPSDNDQRNQESVVEPVGEPPTCATCGGSGWVRNPSGLPLCSENGILGHSPCPSCTPTEPGDAP